MDYEKMTKKLKDIEIQYEKDFGEPWAALQERVLERYPHIRTMLRESDKEFERIKPKNFFQRLFNC